MPRLIMLSRDRFPSERAHSINQIRMCDGFADAGWNVLLLYPDHAYNLPGDLHEFYGLRNRINTIKMKCIAHDITLPAWLMKGRIEQLKNKFITDVVGATTTFSIIRHLLKLVRSGDLCHRDIIYGRSGYFALFIVKLLFLIMGRPNKVALEIHHPPHGRAGLIKFFLKRLDHVFVINNFLLNVFQEKGFKRVSVVPDGVDVVPFNTLLQSSTKFEIRSRLGLPQNCKIVVYAGHLYAYKGVDDLLRTAVLFPEVTFLIVGGFADDVARNRSIAETLGLSNIVFTGFVSPSAVPEYLVASDICVYTLKPNAPIRDFTSPIKLFEYLASGNPTIAANVPGVRDIIRHEESGLLYPPGDDNSLSLAIYRLLSDCELSSRIAHAGIEVAAAHSWSRRAQYVLEILK
ncbi:MAG: glycosyltransferase [Geobacter sp.]|nr:glycosyltransferase [Geobacter sp.]